MIIYTRIVYLCKVLLDVTCLRKVASGELKRTTTLLQTLWQTTENDMTSILKDARVTYDEQFLTEEQAEYFFTVFEKLDWQLRKVGNTKLRRATVAYGDTSTSDKAPRIWGDDLVVLPWTKELLELKKLVEDKVGYYEYSICLGNMYNDGNQFIAMHADNEEYGDTKSIASVSLGANRHFTFKSKTTDENLTLNLAGGSLLLMGENCQEMYRHGMNKEKDVGKRINITFRKFAY